MTPIYMNLTDKANEPTGAEWGLVALGPQISPGCLNILTHPSVPEVQSFRGLLD